MSCDLHRCGVLLLMLLWFVSRAQAAEPRSFYEGKTITLLISTSLGLGRDQVSQRGRASEKIETTVTQPPEVIKRIKEILKESG